MADDLLAARWRALWAGEPAAASVYADLRARYGEAHRAYHTPAHVAGCLAWLDQARPLLARPREAELALWFHDAVYDPRRADNEAQSAALAAAALPALGLDAAAVGRVAGLIRLTSHTAAGPAGDGALVVDIDLAILGAPPADFAGYDAAIRQEYAWVPDDIFRRERARLLEVFLARPRLYVTPYFRDRLEARARANLAWAIARYRA